MKCLLIAEVFVNNDTIIMVTKYHIISLQINKSIT